MPGDAAIRAALAAAPALWPGKASVTVKRTDPDDGSVLATSTGVSAVWRDRRRSVVAGDGGEVAVGTALWRLDAAGVSFVPAKRDTITEADGTVWVLDDCTTACQGTRYLCPATTRLPGT